MFVNKLIFCLAIILIITHKTSASNPWILNCPNNTMFANNSAYQTNLNTLFRSLSSNATNNPSGYHQAIVDNPRSESIYGHYLCLGDQNTSSCHDCVTTATTIDLPITNCSNRKIAYIWYDECMVRYSNVSFFGQMDETPMIYESNLNITGNTTKFMETIKNMMNYASTIAAEGGTVKKFATESMNYSIFETIYGLVQCTPDLSPDDCYTCLSSLAYYFQEPRLDSRLWAPSCFVRYDLNPFFNLSYLPSPSPSPTPATLFPSSSTDPKPINMPSDLKGSMKVSKKLFVSMVTPLFVLLAAILSVCICLLKYVIKKAEMASKSGTVTVRDIDTAESLEHDLQTLLTATSNFSDENKLGEGGFGAVYKGTLPNGKLIAVKRLSASSSQGIQEFKTEVLVVAKLQHKNLVRLLGFCYGEDEKLLVYEHVANKSLDNFLFTHENRRQLNWQRRYSIIRGIARGLLYLHHDSQLRIIHRDLKASNVLLDEEMNPKISDFGTSRIFGVEHSQSNYTNRVVGTYGYMAPEYALYGKFSIKSDTYSFGVLILEIISGRKNSAYNDPVEAEDLLSYVWRQWDAGTPSECVDPTIRDSCANNSEVLRCIQVGLLCVQESIENRPTMANVVLTLDSYSVTLPIPERMYVYDGIRVEPILAKNGGEDQSSNKSKALSTNEVTITELVPR